MPTPRQRHRLLGTPFRRDTPPPLAATRRIFSTDRFERKQPSHCWRHLLVDLIEDGGDGEAVAPLGDRGVDASSGTGSVTW